MLFVHRVAFFAKGACVLLACLTASLSVAGHYEISYSGGKVVATDPDNNRTETPYGPQSGGGWGGAGTTGKKVGNLWMTGPGAVACEGQITVKLEWNNGGDPSDVPPKSVIVTEYSKATWGGDSGSAANGLGHSEQGSPYGGVSEGTKYRIINSDAPMLVYTIEPATSATYGPSSSAPVLSGGADVLLKVTATPVKISFTGTKKVDLDELILIGQGITTQIDAPGFTLVSHSWVVGAGNAEFFHHAEWGQGSTPPYRHVFGPPVGWFNWPLLAYFYDYPGDDEITCTAIAMVGVSPIGVIEAKRPLVVERPDYSMGVKTHTPQSTYITLGGLLQVWCGGITFEGKVTTPSPFSADGTGSWNYTQLIRVDRKRNDEVVATTNGYHYLDNHFPYAGHWPADGASLEEMMDNPVQGLPNNSYSFDINDDFWVFQVYLPPSAGNAIEWVPLKVIEWQWTAAGEYNFGNWTNPIRGSTTPGTQTDLPTWRFQWNNVFTN